MKATWRVPTLWTEILPWDFQNCTRDSVTWTITDHWVKMGCCLPGPLNPGKTGTQPVLKGSDIVMLFYRQMAEPGTLTVWTLCMLIGPCPEGLDGGCKTILKQFNSISLHNRGMVTDLYVSMFQRFFCPSSLYIVYQPGRMLTVRHEVIYSIFSTHVPLQREKVIVWF